MLVGKIIFFIDSSLIKIKDAGGEEFKKSAGTFNFDKAIITITKTKINADGVEKRFCAPTKNLDKIEAALKAGTACFYSEEHDFMMAGPGCDETTKALVREGKMTVHLPDGRVLENRRGAVMTQERKEIRRDTNLGEQYRNSKGGTN